MKRMIVGTILSALFALGTVPAVAGAQNAPTKPVTPPAKPPATAPAAPPAAPQAAAPKPAAPVPFPADAKIGFVNMQYVVSESRFGKAGKDKIDALVNKQNAENVAQNAELQKLDQEIQAGAAVLTAAVLNQKRAELDRLQREAQFRAQQQQVDLAALNDQLLEEFQNKVLPVVEALRAEKNLWLILTQGDGSGIAAVHPGINLSDELVKRLDAVK